MSKWVGNTAFILAYMFNSASRQCCKIWASQFSFLHVHDTVSPSDAYLSDHINWSLAQAHQQSSLGLSQSSACMRGVRATSKDGFMFNVQKKHGLVSGSSLDTEASLGY